VGWCLSVPTCLSDTTTHTAQRNAKTFRLRKPCCLHYSIPDLPSGFPSSGNRRPGGVFTKEPTSWGLPHRNVRQESLSLILSLNLGKALEKKIRKLPDPRLLLLAQAVYQDYDILKAESVANRQEMMMWLLDEVL